MTATISTNSTPKAIWTTVRQAATTTFRHAGEVHVRRDTAASNIRPTVPRGCAPLRDEFAKRLVQLRQTSGDPLAVPLAKRIAPRLVAIYTAVIEARGGETVIPGDNRDTHLDVAHRAGGLTLLRAEGWRYYSRRFGSRPATLAYLCGNDDNGRWAVRVPGTCTTVGQAVEFVEPAEVKKARAAGRGVLRQGDVYLVELKRGGDDLSALEGTRHAFDAATRTLHHSDDRAAHGAVVVPWPRVKAVVQSVLRMGRTNGRRRGD